MPVRLGCETMGSMLDWCSGGARHLLVPVPVLTPTANVGFGPHQPLDARRVVGKCPKLDLVAGDSQDSMARDMERASHFAADPAACPGNDRDALHPAEPTDFLQHSRAGPNGEPAI